jgi:hypothetical protein
MAIKDHAANELYHACMEQILIMKKLLGIVVLGLLKSYPIDYERTSTRPAHGEIKS